MSLADALVDKYFPRELYDVLRALQSKHGERATTMEISELTGVSHTFLLGIIPLLRQKGFISVIEGAEDKRKKLVRLEEGGEGLLESMLIFRRGLAGEPILIKASSKLNSSKEGD